MKYITKILAAFVILAAVAMTFFACSKDKVKMEVPTAQQDQEMTVLSPSRKNPTQNDSIFIQCWSSMVKELFELSIVDSALRYEDWIVKFDSALRSLDEIPFSPVIDGMEHLEDSSYKQMFDGFFINVGTMGVCRSTEILERQLLLSSCSENERSVYLCALSNMKALLVCVEDLQEYLPGSWYYRYLDCMRENYENMNWVAWAGWTLGLPASLGWDVLSCLWDATHSHS